MARFEKLTTSSVGDILLYNKLVALPEHLKSEVNDFIDFLTSKAKQSQKKSKPKFGSGKGIFKLNDNFDQPLEDFNEYTS